MVQGEVFAAGGRVTVSAPVEDDLQVLGGDVTVSAPVGGEMSIAGGTISVARSARIGGKASLAGGNVEIAGTLERGGRILADRLVVARDVDDRRRDFVFAYDRADAVRGITLGNAAGQTLANANGIVAEANFGGDMVAQTIRTVDATVPVKLVTASRSKQVRAEPVAAVFEQKRGHLVGTFPALEDELVLWVPGDASPNRLDALVWALTELMLGGGGWTRGLGK